MKETLLQPSDMIEELMYHIMWNEFDGKLDPDHKYFPLYLSLQQLLEDETRRLEEWIYRRNTYTKAVGTKES